MLEAEGNMLHVDCDALVVTTNGFVKSDGSCVMGRGIAKQIADLDPSIPFKLGSLINRYGNRVFLITNLNGVDILSFPVKPMSATFIGSNAVDHMAPRFKRGDLIPGWACKADPEIIEQSLMELVNLTAANGYNRVICPRFGCGAGELDWNQIQPIAASILDDRFTTYTF